MYSLVILFTYHSWHVRYKYRVHASYNSTECARSDVSCFEIWSPLERTSMDVRIFHPSPPSYMSKSIESLYSYNEKSKKRAYALQWISHKQKIELSHT